MTQKERTKRWLVKNPGIRNEYQRNWKATHEEYRLRKARALKERHARQRRQAIERISRENGLPIACPCGVTDQRLLTINHKAGNGNHDRTSFISRIVKGERAVSDLDIRCYNCQVLYEYEMGRRILPTT